MAAATSHHQATSQLQLKEEDLQSGKTIYPKDLSIVWGDDTRYWNVPKDGSAAELYQVSWLEVTCYVENTKPDKEYEVGFYISLTPDAFGWSGSPVYILAKRGKNGKFTGTKFLLDSVQRAKKDSTPIKIKVPSEQTGGTSEDSKKLYFGMYEVWSGKWKGGLKLHHAVIQEVQ